MRLTKKHRPALVLIDIQKGFDDIAYWGGQRNNSTAEEKASLLLHFWRQNALPIFHIKHCSTNPNSKLAEGNVGNEFKDLVAPRKGELVIKKSVNSAFIGTNLKQLLDEAGIKDLVIIGLTTDHCVSTTARMAANYDFNTFIVHDATATFCKKGIDGKLYSAELIHDTALASLNQEFAMLVTIAQLLDELKH